MTVRILQGDCREMLRTLPADSVHLVVTSPPYWGLRDYATATWEGGDPACDHLAPDSGGFKSSGLGDWGQSQEAIEAKIAKRRKQFKGACGKCGALSVDPQIGREPSFWEFLDELVGVFREVRRVLRPDGVCFVNMGDSYANDGKWGGATGGKHAAHLHGQASRIGREKLRTGLKPKDLVGQPWRLAFALQDDGWWLRRDIIWHQLNRLPEAVADRCTTAHEYLFHLTKSERYFWDAEAIMEPSSADSHARAKRGRSSAHKFADGGPGAQTIARGHPSAGRFIGAPGVSPKSAASGSDVRAKESWHASTTEMLPMRNKRSVWSIASEAFPEAHFATFPPALVEPCILVGTSAKGCCPHCGAAWVRIVEKGEPNREWQKACGADASGGYTGKATKDFAAAGAQDASAVKARILAGMRERVTTGWRATCTCPAHEPVPCTVLDPFGGSGTTGLVAERHGRDSILIELNPEYAEMARRRIDLDKVGRNERRIGHAKMRPEPPKVGLLAMMEGSE